MSSQDIAFRSMTEVAELVRNRDVSPTELTAHLIERIDRIAHRLNCYITVAADAARRRAQMMEDLLRAGTYLGPLHGIPISLKDNIATAGLRTTAGSPILADWIPTQDATLVERLQAAGAVIIGKANLYEFAYGAAHDRFGPTRNPWNLERSCGGSSSGSASAVAAGLCYGSIGTDTGGSIRGPASLCGVIGVRPSYGLVSRAGVIPVSYNLDVAGPMTRTVRDAAVLLQAMAGHDARDATTAAGAAPDYVATIEEGVAGLRLGVLRPGAFEHLHPEAQAAFREAYKVLDREGAILMEVDLPDHRSATTVMWTVASAEAAEYHRPYLRSRANEYHPTVRTLLEVGEFIPATEYVHAQRVRQQLIRDFNATFRTVDAVVVPAFPAPAYPIGARTVRLNGREVELRGMAHYTTLFSVTGRPALVMPCGFSSDGLPLGFQIGGRPFDDATVFRVARAYERATAWHRRHPPI